MRSGFTGETRMTVTMSASTMAIAKHAAVIAHVVSSDSTYFGPYWANSSATPMCTSSRCATG